MALTEEERTFVRETGQEAVSLLKTLAQIPAPSLREEKRAAFCRDWLLAQGAPRVDIDEANNVICPLGDWEGRGPLVVMMAHSDVVFPDTEPLPLSEREGRICCPGVGDDTANVAALLMAAKYVLQKRLRPKEGGVLLVVDAGEEGLGNLRGCRRIMEEYGSRIRHFYSLDAWNGNMNHRAVGSRRFRIRVQAEGGHSYYQFGNSSAIAGLASLIDGIYRMDPPEGTTYNAGLISGGSSVNSIAEQAEMLFEIRSADREDMEELQRRTEERMEEISRRGVRFYTELMGERPCGGAVDPEEEARLMEYAREAYRDAFGAEPSFTPGSTDCNIPLSLGIPSLCVSCFCGGGAHTREEYVETDSLEPGRRVALDLLLRYFR